MSCGPIVEDGSPLTLIVFCAEPKTKTVKESVSDWELLNSVKAIWLRDPKEVSADEYAKFYEALAKVISRFSLPRQAVHFHAQPSYLSELHAF
jgi:HSP90 family molecular chaperone